jgi:2-polyprenyl-6-methoxyphenol hydroxylase-like FAD-dependent oxidoreductase
LANRVGELRDWQQVKLLTVRSGRLKRWFRTGYLAIGDAAHAMNPVGGVGINLAIQDAVVAGNVLWRPLRQGRVSTRDLAADVIFALSDAHLYDTYVRDRCWSRAQVAGWLGDAFCQLLLP